MSLAWDPEFLQHVCLPGTAEFLWHVCLPGATEFLRHVSFSGNFSRVVGNFFAAAIFQYVAVNFI